MRRATVFLVAFVISLLMFCAIVQAAEKFGFVDLSRIFSEYNKTKDYDKTLADKESAYTTERDKKVSDIKQFQDKINLLNEKEKEAKKGDLEAKINTLKEFDRQKETDLRKEQDERMKEILKDIEEAVKKYSEKEGYSLVFNDRVLVYEAKNLEITDKIIEILNKGYKK
ncbi:MAG: OmpH family outer membrane protein [Candidatus Omnitrophota bacterium]